MRYSFAGHETFTCKNYWLKKGYDHSREGKKFNDNAVIDLGVGKNMVNSIRRKRLISTTSFLIIFEN